MAVKDLCRRYGFSEASCYLWRSKFCGISVPDAKRLKELEAENTVLKKLHVRTPIETWRWKYNEERPKQALGGLTPAGYAK